MVRFQDNLKPGVLTNLERYAIAAHWYINASPQELEERDETREEALSRVHQIESEMLFSQCNLLQTHPLDL